MAAPFGNFQPAGQISSTAPVASLLPVIVPAVAAAKLYHTPVVLEPGETKEYDFSFPKFYDDGDTSQNIVFNAIRIRIITIKNLKNLFLFIISLKLVFFN